MKLNLITSKDELRPALNYVLVTKEIVYATNAYIAVKVPTEALFNDSFIDSLENDERLLIHRDDWAKIHDLSLVERKGTSDIFISKHKSKRQFVFEAEKESETGVYPSFEGIYPKIEDKTEINQIGLNPQFLALFSKAVGCDSLKMTFFGQNKGVLLEPNCEGFTFEGLIMPMLIKY